MMVSVLMPTYNHERYIGQAIESFLAQECDFPIELLISNDRSTDGTLAVAQRYAQAHPDKIRLFDQTTNLGLMRNYKFLLEQSSARYFAILESDDYWIDPHKLQKQVTVLEADPEVGLVYTNWHNIDESGTVVRSSHIDLSLQGDMYEQEIACNIWAAVTVCFSAEKFRTLCSIDDYIAQGFKTFDYPTWLALTANSKVTFLPDFTAAYRLLGSSISNNADWDKMLDFAHSNKRIIDYSIARFGQGTLTDSQVNNAHYKGMMILALSYGRKKEFYHYARQIKAIDLKTFVLRYLPEVFALKNRRIKR